MSTSSRALTRAAILATAITVFAARGLPQDGQPTNIRDGIYTETQAEAGGQIFANVCTICHTAEGFSGAEFLGEWEESTALDLFDFVRFAMPAGIHEGRPEREYLNVTAYILQLNEMPAGETPLRSDPDFLRRIRIAAPEE